MFISDFHIHSKYSRATSKNMDVENISTWARLKGVDLVGTGDFTHPEWLKELKTKLEPVEYGIYSHQGVYYILTGEVNNIFFKYGKSRRIHNIIFIPSFEIAEAVNRMLSKYGMLFADGRPIVHMDCEKMLKELRVISNDIFVVPAHIWTPYFSLFGGKSGFDSIEGCFGDEAEYIYALETGLSSDPAMNWRWSALDRFSLISNSDAHSPQKIGREANVFKEKFGYTELKEILRKKDISKFLFTIEFYPQEGKYHWNGHRKCNLRVSPGQTYELGGTCPTCGKKITAGVLHRVENLGNREEGYILADSPSYKNLVPLIEIISGAIGKGVQSLAVKKEYNRLIPGAGNELSILLDIPADKLARYCNTRIAEGIINARNGDVEIIPGYDGEYGSVNVFKKPKKMFGEVRK